MGYPTERGEGQPIQIGKEDRAPRVSLKKTKIDYMTFFILLRGDLHFWKIGYKLMSTTENTKQMKNVYY